MFWRRAVNIIVAPEKTWQEIKTEQVELKDLIRGYAAPLALVPVVSSFIRLLLMRVSYLTFGFVVDLLISSLVNYILFLAALLLAGWVTSILARFFASKSDLLSGLKVITYSLTPIWLSSVFQFIPRLSVLGILSFYGAYLVFTALPVVLETPSDKQVGLAASVCGFGFILLMYLSIITGGVIYR